MAQLTPQQEAARIAEIQRRIESRGLHWTAGRTALTALTWEEMQTRLGLRIPPEYGDIPSGGGKEDLAPGSTGAGALEDVAPAAPAPSMGANAGALGAGARAPSAPEAVALAAPAPAGAAGPPFALPARWDWRELGGTTPARDQRRCGSCWAFAAIAAAESAIRIHSGEDVDLSEQQMLSCNLYGYGCDGGWMTAVYRHLRSTGGVTEACMPYTADDGAPCLQSQCAARRYLDGYRAVTTTTRDLKLALLRGPFAAAMAVSEDFSAYTGGCYSHPDARTPNHAILMVGWDDTLCGGEGAWICKNSWGTDWGEEGFFHLAYGNCSIGFGAEQVDYTPPSGIVIAHGVPEDPLSGAGGVELRAVVATPGETHAAGSPSLRYRVGGGAFAALPMAPTGEPNEFLAHIPAQLDGALVEYYFEAATLEGSEQTDPLAAPLHTHRLRFGYTVLYAFDGESGTAGWSHGPVTDGRGDQWHLSTQRNHTPGGSRCWKCGPVGRDNYQPLLDAGLVTPAITLPAQAMLRFHHWIDAERSPFELGWAYDGGIVEISLDGGQSWTQLAPVNEWPYRARRGAAPGPFAAGTGLFSGSEGWREERFDLSGFEGEAQLRFRFGSDGAVAFEGWCLDDIQVLGLAPGSPPVPVRLLEFAGAWVEPKITLSWQIDDPRGVLGFHLGRSPWPGGPFERRTAAMIAAGGQEEDAFSFVDAAPADAEGAYYRLIAVELSGAETPLGLTRVLRGQQSAPAQRARLLANVPNPFDAVTALHFELPLAAAPSPVLLEVFDLQGRLVARPLEAREMAPGTHWTLWDGRDLGGRFVPAGAYCARLQAGAERVVRTITVIR
ncbi:MAG: immune inhibitor A [Candidatus Eisenbacteria bacterium]|uniref:Immune inhibitor A n=1 Tax=Eiseniibacteriota bacterium TaxID=2212470 RepID=A0A937X973_UNCEI|nr:immune inhibitor A [Candidatus Eisenbacteria bacterium]